MMFGYEDFWTHARDRVSQLLEIWHDEDFGTVLADVNIPRPTSLSTLPCSRPCLPVCRLNLRITNHQRNPNN